MTRLIGYLAQSERDAGTPVTFPNLGVLDTVAHYAVAPYSGGGLNTRFRGAFPDRELAQQLRQHGKGFVLVVGGGSPATMAQNFATLASIPEARALFIASLIRLLATEGYTGVELQWEAPANPLDARNCIALVDALRQALPHAMTLSIAVPPQVPVLDLSQLVPLVDWVVSLTLDFNQGLPTAYYGSPLFPDVDASVSYLLGKGVPNEKLVLLVPCYGTQYTSAPGVGATLGRNDPGTQVAETTIEHYLTSGAWVRQYDTAAQQPFLLPSGGGMGLVVYDDEQSLLAKAHYIQALELGGVGLFTIGQASASYQTAMRTLKGFLN